jgi:glycerol-3-phosphate dehydrogenase
VAEAPPILDRMRDLDRVAAAPEGFDVLIIGAGINGAAVFWDLSLQGVRCLLVDREDIAAGASSASTRMAHGGLRYLENGEVRLVAEATRERNRLLRNAPHYVRPLPVAIPAFAQVAGALAAAFRFFGHDRKLHLRGLQIVRLGLLVYDWLGRHERTLPRHRIENAAAARAALPALHPAVRGVATYYDAAISQAERLNLELVEDGIAACPDGAVLNHCAVEAVRDGAVTLVDRLAGRRLEVRPRLVVNATGAWIDGVNRTLGIARPLIGGTKGSHLVLDCPALHAALAGRAFSFDDGRGRLCIVYPMGGAVLLGSTDIRIEDPDAAVCDAAETDYLLGAIRLIFPMVEVSAEHVRFRFCGVRPLPRAERAETGTISRDHAIERDGSTAERPWPVLSLVGGKWTTFRAFAEQVTDAVLGTLELQRRMTTTERAIGGGKDYPTDAAGRERCLTELGQLGCAAARAAVLLERYGTRAARVARFCADAADSPLVQAPDFTAREIAFIGSQEMAETLGDLVFRRTTLAIEGRLTGPLVAELASRLAAAKGKDAAWARSEAERLGRLLRERHGQEIGEPGTPMRALEGVAS